MSNEKKFEGVSLEEKELDLEDLEQVAGGNNVTDARNAIDSTTTGVTTNLLNQIVIAEIPNRFVNESQEETINPSLAELITRQ